MKKLILSSLLAAVAFCATAQPAYYQQSSPKNIINSTIGPTNQIVGTNGIFLYPSFVAAGTSVTNCTPFSVPGKDLAIQFNAQIATASSANATNIIVQLGRSVQLPSQMPSGGVTNAAGSGMNIEWFATITNTLPASAAANTTYVSHALFGPITGQSSGSGDGAVTTFYIGYITTPASTVLTNYSFWVNGQ